MYFFKRMCHLKQPSRSYLGNNTELGQFSLKELQLPLHNETMSVGTTVESRNSF